MGSSHRGFTILELMLAVMIVGLLAAIALYNYRAYLLRADASMAEQELRRQSAELERYKSRNFNYFNFPTSTITLPVGATGTAIKYTITIRDGGNTSLNLDDDNVTGRSWVMRAEAAAGSNNYTYLLTSGGKYCRNKAAANVTYAVCGTGEQASW